MRSRLVALTALASMVVLVAGCGTDPAPAPAGPVMLRAEGVQRLDPSAGAPVAEVVEGITRFGYELAPTSPGENWVASPTSIAIALAMVRAGAGGGTAAEIDEVFGFPAGVHEAFNALTRQVITADVPPAGDEATPTRAPGAPARPSTVCVGNAVFPAQDFEIKQAYLRTLAEQYGTGVYPIDFHQPSAVEQINDWARRQTADRIDKVFDQLDPETALVLANTAYLKGEWWVPFDEAATADEEFRRADASTVQVPMMHLTADLPYASGDGWQAVEVPYGADGSFAMRIVVPTGSTAPRDLLAPEVQASIASGRNTHRVGLALPRWDFASDVKLGEELVRLGIVDAFDADRADFSGISPVRLYIQQAVHRANISVDEFGTEAAAVTAVVMAPTAAAPSPELTVRADRPFAFAIVHVATGAPLFIGQVADPAAH